MASQSTVACQSLRARSNVTKSKIVRGQSENIRLSPLNNPQLCKRHAVPYPIPFIVHMRQVTLHVCLWHEQSNTKNRMSTSQYQYMNENETHVFAHVLSEIEHMFLHCLSTCAQQVSLKQLRDVVFCFSLPAIELLVLLLSFTLLFCEFFRGDTNFRDRWLFHCCCFLWCALLCKLALAD